MTGRDERDHVRVDEEVRSLDPGSRDVLAVLAVCGGASLSAEELAEIAEVPEVEPVLAQLERRGLVVRDGDRYSLAPPAHGRLKGLLASVDLCDRVLRAFISIAEDGRLTLADLDAVVELTGIAADLGQWKLLLRLAQAAETTLSITHRVEEWVAIVERLRDAARALGDDDAAGRAERELARLKARAPSSAAPAGVGRAARAALSLLAATALGAAAGYFVGDRSSGKPSQTVTATGAAATETATQTGPTETVIVPTTVTSTTTTTTTIFTTSQPSIREVGPSTGG